MSLESLVRDSLSDFPDEDASPEAIEAAKIAQSSITKGTYEGHIRYVGLLFHSTIAYGLCSIIKAYILYHRKRDRNWDPHAITQDTPLHIRNFIQKKCGDKSQGFEGCKVCFWRYILGDVEYLH